MSENARSLTHPSFFASGSNPIMLDQTFTNCSLGSHLLDMTWFPYDTSTIKPSTWIIASFWSFALSVIMNDLSRDFARVTPHGRKAVQFLFHVLGEAKKLMAIRSHNAYIILRYSSLVGLYP